MKRKVINKRVFVLGAGSSIGHSQQCTTAQNLPNAPHIFPSIGEFFQKAKELGLHQSHQFKYVSEYALRWFGWDVWKKKKVDIEELFTHIEIELERGRSPRLLEVRQDLLVLIRETLNRLGEPILGGVGEYASFQRPEILSEADTSITFNWDLLLDQLLGRETLLTRWYGEASLGEMHIKQYINFLIRLSAIGERTVTNAVIHDPYSVWSGSVGYYLKLHGSIDWFYCANDRCRGAGRVFPIQEFNRLHKCADCHEPLEELVIPPVLNKAYRQYPLIRRIWNLASQELRTATELIIWGYSLPATDFHSAWLLRQAREAPLRKMAIINPEVDKANAKSIRRLASFFHDKLSNDQIFLYRSFGEYCDDKPVGTIQKWNLDRRSYRESLRTA